MNDLDAVATGFVFGSLAMAPALFAGFYVWSVMDVDCIGDFWACRQSLILPTFLRVGLPLLLWEACLAALVRAWVKD